MSAAMCSLAEATAVAAAPHPSRSDLETCLVQQLQLERWSPSDRQLIVASLAAHLTACARAEDGTLDIGGTMQQEHQQLLSQSWQALDSGACEHGEARCVLPDMCMCTHRGRHHNCHELVQEGTDLRSCRAWLQILAQLVQGHAPDLDIERCLEAAGQVSPGAVVAMAHARIWHMCAFVLAGCSGMSSDQLELPCADPPSPTPACAAPAG